MELLATDLLKVKFSNTAPGGMTYSGDLGVDDVTIIATRATKSKAENHPLCVASVNALFTAATPCPHTFAGHTFTAGGGAVAVATATKTKDTGIPILRKGDSGTCIGAWVNTASGAAVPCACNAEISDPGQGVASGN